MHLPIHGSSRSSLHFPRFTGFPGPLSRILFLRYASTASASENGSSDDPNTIANNFPFPKHPHPTPYEIFHLRPGARPGEIKSRYYQLVRIHHPDTPYARQLPSHISRARFQAIQAAHDILIGKKRRSDFPSATHPTTGRGHASHLYRRSHDHNAEWSNAAEEAEESTDDRRKDQTIILGAIAIIGLVVVPFFTSFATYNANHRSAVQNLAQARREARELGMIRRREIRKRVRTNELEREYEDKRVSSGSPEGTDGKVDRLIER